MQLVGMLEFEMQNLRCFIKNDTGDWLVCGKEGSFRWFVDNV